MTNDFTHPPRRLRAARLDNIALVPASLLPYKDAWQAVANKLPEGGALIVLPASKSRNRGVAEKVADGLRALGHEVQTLEAEVFEPAASPTSAQLQLF